MRCEYLKYFNDLQLCVHYQDVLFLWFALLDVTLRSSSKRSHGQEPPASEHHLGHQLTHAVDWSHHIAPFREAGKQVRLWRCNGTALTGQGPSTAYEEKVSQHETRPSGHLNPWNRWKSTAALQYCQNPPALSFFHRRHHSAVQPSHRQKGVEDFKPIDIWRRTRNYQRTIQSANHFSALPLLSSPFAILVIGKMVVMCTQSNIARRILVSLRRSQKL